MPSPKSSHRNAQNQIVESHRRGRLGDQSSSFHTESSSPTTMSSSSSSSSAQLRRPKTVPDLLSYRNHAMTTVPEGLPRQPPKLLLKVTMMGSLGPVQVVMRPELTVGDLVAEAVRHYVKEGRRPILPTNYPADFDLHYSQFSLESLDREGKLMELGSRNFFLCPRKSSSTVGAGGSNSRDGSVTTPFASCSKEADKVTGDGGGGGRGGGFAWQKLMQFLL